MFKLLSKSINFTSININKLIKNSKLLQIKRFDSNSVNFIPLTFPALSPTMSVGKIHQWKVKEGDKLEIGKTICEVETDKAIIDFDSSNEEYIAKILSDKKSGEIQVGKTIALLTEKKEDIEKVKNMKYEDNDNDKNITVTSKSPKKSHSNDKNTSEENNKNNNKIDLSKYRLSPSARAFIYSEETNINLDLIKGTGKRGLITKEDVLNHLMNKQQQTNNVINAIKETEDIEKDKSNIKSDVTIITPSNMRRIIAERLTESKIQLPHSYTLIDIEVYYNYLIHLCILDG